MGRSRRIGDRFPKGRAIRSRSIVGSFPMCRMPFLKGRSRRFIRRLSEPFESVCGARFGKRFNWLPEASRERVGRSGIDLQHDTTGTGSRFGLFMA